MTEIEAVLEAACRQEAARVVGALTRAYGRFDVAEEAFQEALLAAWEHWGRSGVPDRPGAWLMQVARNRAIDRLRREGIGREKVAQAMRPAPSTDDPLRLMFTCCHPALQAEARLPLTLRAVCGFSTGQIAHALLLSEAAVAQRIARARRKVADAGIPYRIPQGDELDERLDSVLSVLYLMFNEGYLASADGAVVRREMAAEAATLTRQLTVLFPLEPEPLGLWALMRLHEARVRARFTPDGQLVRLMDQDRGLWHRVAIAEAVATLERAAHMGRPARYQIEAAIVACHAESPSFEATDWLQIVMLYDLLLQHVDTPVVRLNRAIALRYAVGVEAALVEVAALSRDLDDYHLFHATRAELLRAAGREGQARAAAARAFALTQNPAERALLALEYGPDLDGATGPVPG